MKNMSVEIPTLVRIKPGALDRVGLYCRRAGFQRVVVLTSASLPAAIPERLARALGGEGIHRLQQAEIATANYDQAQALFRAVPPEADAIVGAGGGKAVDVAKYVAFLLRRPFIAVPTSLSNDGFCSPQSSLEMNGRRRSLPSAMPYGVVVDTDVCLDAPPVLWCAGIGDSVAKITAVADWKRAFHARGTPVNDLAALLSDATVFQLLASPRRDRESMAVLATALMLNGVAMEIAGSSRPASGSEHLISHALDQLSSRPRLHGLQVGMATYLISHLQRHRTEKIAALFDATGFWGEIRADPFVRGEWINAIRAAPAMKSGFHTILSERDYTGELTQLIDTDPRLQGLFL